MPAHLRLDNFPEAHTQVNQSAIERGSSLAHYIAAEWDAGLKWTDVEWLRSVSPLPVLVKGVLAPADARAAADHGAAGVVVSNHGGRQLDGVPAPITMLPAIRDAVAGDIEILIDGGVRRGTDVLKAWPSAPVP
jgi:isopentenyl diphosphate isomerase/L-lactate dehydrogenase-like FMN-dependent dehydrogenase